MHFWWKRNEYVDALACVAGVEGEGKEKNRLHEARNTQAMDAIHVLTWEGPGKVTWTCGRVERGFARRGVGHSDLQHFRFCIMDIQNLTLKLKSAVHRENRPSYKPQEMEAAL